jgi:hypothetical protein
MAPERLTGSAFAATRYPTEPSPCPFAEDVRDIQEAFDAALHVQSRSTVMETVPTPPVDPYDDGEVDASAWHRLDVAADGAATLVVAELPQASVSERTEAVVRAARR